MVAVLTTRKDALAARRSAVDELALAQAGVVSRTQLYRAGLSRGEVRAQVRARRWRRLGCHAIATFTGPLSEPARHWAAVLEGGPRAYIDGASALLLAGLQGFRVDQIRVTVPRGARIRHRPSGIDIRQTRRWCSGDVQPSGMPCARPPGAAVRAALWARSDRQATLLLTMTVQQGLASVGDLAAELLRVRRDRRRTLIAEVLVDLGGGVGSLGELDFLRGCRERGLPEPDKQVLRRGKDGRYYLDFRWHRWRVTLEVDGIQHGWAQNAVTDALRHNSIALTGDIVLRLPVTGLRFAPDEFFAQIEAALRSRGCPPSIDRSA